MGPIHTRAGRDELLAQLEDSGGEVLIGGGTGGHDKGWFLEPAVVSEPRPDSRLLREEVFGPVLPVLRYSDFDDAIARANDTPYGLGSSLWTHDVRKIHRAARDIDAGMTWVNQIHYGYDELPFGGVKASGYGKEHGHEALASIARSPKLFVAWIAGHALGGGLEIALACDLRYAAEGSYRLGTPEVTLGLLPGNGGTQRLPRIIGRGPALDLLLTGRQVDPAEAQRLGIVSALFADEESFRAHVEKLAAGPPLAVANIKRAVYQGLDVTLEEGLTLERELVEQLFRSQDANEGLTAFSEKRTPTFTG